jgi:hypothetical protein
MSRKTRSRMRMLFALPSAAALMLGASQALASPPPPPPDDCRAYCEGHWAYCAANPATFSCRFCGCNVE